MDLKPRRQLDVFIDEELVEPVPDHEQDRREQESVDCGEHRHDRCLQLDVELHEFEDRRAYLP